MNGIYDNERLKERQSAPLALTASGIASSEVPFGTKPDCHERSGNTVGSSGPNVGNHTVFVLGPNGRPLTPTTPSRARKLLRVKVVKKVWSKFNTFGIQLLEKTREEMPKSTLGYDLGTRLEGISVVCGEENNLSVKLDLPDKKKIVKRLKERREIRRSRRSRNCRRRKPRFQNRRRKGFIAPSQLVIVSSRLKVLREFCRIYPINTVAVEDIKFNHVKKRWGTNFSTMEIGKQRIRDFFKNRNIEIVEYRGFETAEIRKKYGYKKTAVKNADKFSAHCCDSLALATEVSCGKYVSQGKFLIVDDTYRYIRRKLHDINPSTRGIRERYTQGTVNNIGKGIMIGTKRGNVGQLCGEKKSSFRYYDLSGKRKTTKNLLWLNNQLRVKSGAECLAKSFGL
jgi:hypothetical protein